MDSWRTSTCISCISDNLNRARSVVSLLSAEEKALLLQEMLGGLGGGDFVTINVVRQIQSGNVNLSEVFRAAAFRISQEKLVP